MKDLCQVCRMPATVHNRHGDFCALDWADFAEKHNKAGTGIEGATETLPSEPPPSEPKVVNPQPTSPPKWFTNMLQAYEKLKLANIPEEQAIELAWSVLKGEVRK